MINLHMVTLANVCDGKIKKTQFDPMSRILSSINWSIAFFGCSDVGSYTAVFMRELNRALA